MSISITEDEHDKQARRVTEEARDVIRRNAGNPARISEELHARGLRDKSRITGAEDGKRYKWVNRKTREGERVDEHIGEGYDVVDPTTSPVKPIVGRKHEGGWVRGDLVLMECPEAVYEARRRDARVRGELQSEASIETTIDNLNRIARDEGRVPAHKDIAFRDTAASEEPFESTARANYGSGGKPKQK